jgi:Fe-S-cluster-containing hydrogenase component 2
MSCNKGVIMKIIMVDPSKCTGCRSCEIACSFEKLRECNPSRARIHVVCNRITGKNLPVVCQQCRDAPCKAVCPTKAIYEDEKTHAIVVNKNKCIGCRQCVMACPFGAIDVFLDIGHSFKCDLCDGNPQCVEACTENALTFIEETRESRAKNRLVAATFVSSTQSYEGDAADLSDDAYTEWKKVV